MKDTFHFSVIIQLSCWILLYIEHKFSFVSNIYLIIETAFVLSLVWTYNSFILTNNNGGKK